MTVAQSLAVRIECLRLNLPMNSQPSFPLRVYECAPRLTFFIEVEVLQALVEVACGGGGADVGVGVDGAQAGDGRAVLHWRQVAWLWRTGLVGGKNTQNVQHSSSSVQDWLEGRQHNRQKKPR